MSLDSRFEGKEGSSHFEACELVIPLLEKMGIPFFLPLPLVERLQTFAYRRAYSLLLTFRAHLAPKGVGPCEEEDSSLAVKSAYSWSIVQLMISFWTSFQAYANHTYRFLVQEFLKIKVRKDQERSALRSSSRSEGAKESNDIVALPAKGECD